MRILILGGDGYLGWPTAMRFSDAATRSTSSTTTSGAARTRRPGPTRSSRSAPRCRSGSGRGARSRVWRSASPRRPDRLATFVERVFRDFRPDTIVHYGESRRAPVLDDRPPSTRCTRRRTTSIGNLNVLFAIRDIAPGRHLVKLGTMGEYGTPEHRHRRGLPRDRPQRAARDTLPFPKTPGSMYHLSKVHDSHNIHFACRIWGLRATDLNQGVVYGIETDESALDPRLRDELPLRRGLRDRAQPLLRPGGDRPSADRLRQGRPDPRLPQHPRHGRVRRARGDEPGRARASSASSTSSPSSSASLELAERVKRGRRAARLEVDDRAHREPADRAGAALLQRRAHEAARPRPASRACSREKLIESMFVVDRAVQGPRDRRHILRVIGGGRAPR